MAPASSIVKGVDRNWPVAIAVGAGFGGLATWIAWSHISAGPILIGRLDPSTRSVLYGSLAGSAGALLGLTIASLAILLTLDETRPSVAAMQSLDAWGILNQTLLAATAFLALDLLLATIAIGVDSARRGESWVEAAVFAVSTAAFCELSVGVTAFGIVVRNVTGRA